jgi:hypothetical protein
MMRFGLLVLICLLAGCGGSGTSSVEGVVTFDDKPLPNASIQFVPQGDGRDATGQTDDSGHFTMSTLKPGDGVMPGDYKVVITPPMESTVPQQFATAEEAMNAASKAPPPKSAVPNFPQKYARVDQTPLTQKVPTDGRVTFELKSK